MKLPARYEEDILLFFSGKQGAKALYDCLYEKMETLFPGAELKLQKTQITFKDRYGFAFVSLRRMKGCPEAFILLSFGLDRELGSPRIAAKAEPYPGRWTHHMVISKPEELDEEVLGWLQQAHAFALMK